MKFPTWLKVYGDQSYRNPKCPLEAAESGTFFNQIRNHHPKKDLLSTVVFHVKNEGKKHFEQVKKDKMQGQVKGASDVVGVGRISFVMEIKREDHTKSHWEDGQQEFLKAAQDNGAFVCVALGHKAAIQALNDWIKENHSKSGLVSRNIESGVPHSSSLNWYIMVSPPLSTSKK